MQNPAIRNIFSQGFGLEILYTFIIILASLMIYIATKEIYNLTKHKGIKYFRQGFLFFAIAYFFRSFIKFIILHFNLTKILDLQLKELGILTLFAFIYFSSMAIFYLLYSVLYKKLDKNQDDQESSKIYIFHILAIAIALTITLFKNPLAYLIINLIFLALILIMVYYAKSSIKDKIKTKNKHNYLYTTYILLFIFWILNILDILIPEFLRTTQLFIYLASITIFMTILYKVLKKSGN